MEYEVKFKIEGKEDILPKLKRLRAEDMGEELEVDRYFILNDKGVRVRRVGEKGFVTLKRLVDTDSLAKVREEIETEVSNVDNLMEILRDLGLSEVKRKEKKRHTFKLDDVLVLVDLLPFMGYFVEIEASSDEALKRAAKKLGFDYNLAIGNSYDNMFFNYYVKNAKKLQNTKVKIIPVFENEREFLREQEQKSG